MSDESSHDQDSDFEGGSHCYACRGSHPPGPYDNDDDQIIRVECNNVITGITTCAKI